MPGDTLGGGIVIASVNYREAGDNTIPEHMRDERHNDDLYTVLILNPETPYYTVGTGYWNQEQYFEWLHSENHANIVPAVNGDFLSEDGAIHLTRVEGTFEAEKKPGYVDLGGDY